MIKATLPPKCYTEQYWFDLEQEKIFGQLWLFVGLQQQFENENDFVARDFSGTPVLVQRIGGELRAFRNACAHRGMPLQIQGCGNRKLICPYHGWSYRENGQLRGIPNENIFNICKEEKLDISLKSYALEVVGSFVFVNLSSNPIPISEQFGGDLLLVLREVSLHFATEFSYAKFPGEYNWKLNFENVLDWNHVQFVHPQTFAPLLDIAGEDAFELKALKKSLLFSPESSLAGVKFSEDVDSGISIQLKNISRIGRGSMAYAPRWFSGLMENAVDPGSFFACHMFPNLNFGSIHGEHFYIQQFVPVAPNKIEYHSGVFTAKLKSTAPPQPHLLWGIHHAEKKVIDEDIVLFHALQKSLESAPATSIERMGDHEASLAAIGTWYLQHLKD